MFTDSGFLLIADSVSRFHRKSLNPPFPYFYDTNTINGKGRFAAGVGRISLPKDLTNRTTPGRIPTCGYQRRIRLTRERQFFQVLHRSNNTLILYFVVSVQIDLNVLRAQFHFQVRSYCIS